jgi:ketosteroid isomerase-like protein
METSQQKSIIESYVRAYNAFDLAGMTQHLHPDVTFENVSNGEVDLKTEGIDAFREQAERAKHLFAQREQRITDWTFDGDQVTIDIDYDGTLAIDLPNGLEAGDQLSMQGQSEFHFRDGQIILLRDRS